MSPDELHNHLARIGSSGGNANTEEQQKTRRLNAYKTLAKRYPTSVKIRQQLQKLEKQSAERSEKEASGD